MTAPDSQLPAPERAPRRLQHCLAAVGILVAGALAYANGLDGEFLLDDIGHIPDNPHIRMTELEWGALREAAFESLDPQRPLANVSLALNHYWGGYEPRGYHRFNVAVHLLNGVLVYLLAWLSFRRLFALEPARRDPNSCALAALAAGLVFTLHPLQTQAVTYVIQRMTSLAVLFYLLALIAFVLGRERPSGPARAALWVAAVAAWVLALASKQIAITLPVAVLLYELFFFRDFESARLRRVLVPALCAAGFAMLCGVLVFVSGDLFSYAARDFSMGERLLTQLRVVALYLGLVLWPAPGRLNIAHDVSTSHGLLDPPSTLACLVLLLGLLAVAIFAARRDRLLSFAILWLFANLALESSIVPLELVFEHRMYLPMVGLALFVGDGLFRLVPGRRSVGVAATLALVLLLGAGTHVRNRAWATGLSLWSDSAGKSAGSFRAQYDYGVALYQDGQLERAREQFERAIEIDTDAGEAHANLAVVLSDVGRLEEATAAFQRAAAVEPEEPQHRYQLGLVFAKRQMFGPAAANFRQALRLDPDHEPSRRALLAAERALISGS